MEVRKGFKQTEVGVIPEDWEIKPIKNLNFDISDGNYSSRYPKASDFRAFGVPFIRANNIKGLKVVDDDLRYISEEQHAELLSGHLKKNDILITTRGDIGQIAFVPDRHIDSNINAQLVRINVGKTGHSHRYVGYVLTFGNVQKQFESLQTGSALKQLPVGKLITLNIPLPPTLAEQEAIAEALSDADALIESLETLLAKKRQVKQGAMSELLTGKRRLPGFSGEWEKKQFGSVLKFQVGFPFSSSFFNEKGDGIRLVKNRDLKSDDQVFHYSGKYDPQFLVRDGDVLIGMDGEFIPCLWSKGLALLNQRVGRIIPLSGLDRTFASYYLIEPLRQIENSTSSTTVKHLSHGNIVNIEMPLPNIAEQTAIAEILSDMDTEIRAVEEKLSKARAVKAGMMSALLGGRVRLV